MDNNLNVLDHAPFGVFVGDVTHISYQNHVLNSWIPPEEQERWQQSYLHAINTWDKQNPTQYSFHFEQEEGEVYVLVSLVSTPAGIQGVVYDMSKQEQVLKDALARAEAANNAKNQFLSRMSHELRTPLNTIIASAQLLQLKGLDPKHERGVERILISGQHLLELINNVLDIARIETGRLALNIEQLSVMDTVAAAMQQIQPLASQRDIKVSVGQQENIFAYADASRLKQVLVHILNNAVQYNKEKGRVHIDVERSGQSVRIKIMDTGMGMPPETVSKLFVAFQKSNKAEGAGMGLALSKQLIEAMGGKIGAESIPNYGSTLWLELNTSKPSTQLAPVEPPRVLAFVGKEQHFAHLQELVQIFGRIDLKAMLPEELPNFKGSGVLVYWDDLSPLPPQFSQLSKDTTICMVNVGMMAEFQRCFQHVLPLPLKMKVLQQKLFDTGIL